MTRELHRRVISALVYGAVVLAALFFGLPLFLPAVAIGALLAYFELWRLFAGRPYAPSLIGGLVLVVVFLAQHLLDALVRAATLGTPPAASAAVVLLQSGTVLTVALLAAGLLALRSRDLASGLLAALLTIGGALYCGWLLGYLIDLAVAGAVLTGPFESELLPRSLVALAIFPTWAADVVAYAVGSAVGRRKLLPHVSPGKTVEGTLGGLAAAVLTAFIIAAAVEFPLWVGLVAGLIVGVAAPLGDLVESAIKRAATVKDAGGLLPGHGGILDRLDSLIFVAPALALFFELALRLT